MQITLIELAKLLGAELVGDRDKVITGVSPIENGAPQTISFLGNPKYEPQIYLTKATAVVVDKNFIPSQKLSTDLIKVDNVYESLAFLLEKFSPKPENEKGISSQAFIDPTAKISTDVYIGHFSVISAGVIIGKNTKIHPQAYIGENVKIGSDCIIYPGVRILRDCEVGNQCVIFSNAVIGSDGFGYAPTQDGSYKSIPQVGKVILEDKVEIGANTAIDRATMGATIIREGAKLDNLIQIGHNVEIGKHTVMAALSGVSGSTKIGKYCRVGGQVGFAGHLTVADHTQIMAQSGLIKHVNQEKSILCGAPAIDYKTYFKSFALFKKLPALEKRIRELENRLGTLEEND